MRFCATDYTGLSPEAALVIPSEFSREEVKAELLSAGPLVGEALSSAVGFAQRIVSGARGTAVTRVSRAGENGFFSLLCDQVGGDRARIPRWSRSVRTARNWAAHAEEESVLLERLAEFSVRSRAFIASARAAWTQWLEATDQFDDARIFEEATRIVQGGTALRLPRRIDVWRFGRGDAREEYFWSAMATRTEVQFGLPDLAPAGDAHFEKVLHASGVGEALEKSQGIDAVLFEDDPRTRRELLRLWGARLADERDPTRVRMREILKHLGPVPKERRRAALNELRELSRADLDLVMHAWDTFDVSIELAGDRSAWDLHLKTLAPPPSKLVPRSGVRLVRYGQALLQPCENLLILPDRGGGGKDAEGRSDDWLSSAELECLSEFGLKGAKERLEERERIVSWVRSRAHSITRVELEPRVGNVATAEGRATEVRLPSRDLKRVRASDIDAFSRCAFLGLTRARWRVEDLIDSKLDTSPLEKGITLHEAARKLVDRLQSGLENGPKSPEESFDDVFEEILASARPWERQRWKEVLELFLEKEKDVRQKFQNKTLASEFELEWPLGGESDPVLYGRADRLDETARGEILVIDYKSGSGQPQGQEMVGQGYALQMPFYAVAARRHFQREVAGAQFVELNSGGSRARGIFFKSRVGPKAPAVAAIRSNSKSLLPNEPEEVWRNLENELRSAVSLLAQGHHDAAPKDPSDCLRCSAAIACNALRRKTG